MIMLSHGASVFQWIRVQCCSLVSHIDPLCSFALYAQPLQENSLLENHKAQHYVNSPEKSHTCPCAHEKMCVRYLCRNKIAQSMNAMCILRFSRSFQMILTWQLYQLPLSAEWSKNPHFIPSLVHVSVPIHFLFCSGQA